MAVLDSVAQLFPIRNSGAQKKRFQEWVLSEAGRAGFEAEIENADGHENIVIGDIKRAKCLFAAHYDTPYMAAFPNLMLPMNRWLHLAYVLGSLLPFLGLAVGAVAAAYCWLPLDYTKLTCRLVPFAAFLLTYYAPFLLLSRTFPNKNNVNDNTSGLSVVLESMLALPEADRQAAAFVLFDNEEKGKKGSKAFAKKHGELLKNKPVINFDCVGNGGTYIVSSRTAFLNSPAYAPFEAAFSALPNAMLLSEKKAKANSDQTSFKVSAAVLAANKSRRGIFYVNRIHTNRDTVSDAANIETLKNTVISYIYRLNGEE